jgi:hypothetical protein
VSRRLAALATPVFTGLERIVERRVAVYARAGANIGDAPPAPLTGRGGPNADVTVATASSRRAAERSASSSAGQPAPQQPAPRHLAARSGAVRSHTTANRGGASAANLASSSRRSHGVSVIYIGFQVRARSLRLLASVRESILGGGASFLVLVASSDAYSVYHIVC